MPAKLMHLKLTLFFHIAAGLLLTSCADAITQLSSTVQQDFTAEAAHPDAVMGESKLLSAFYGLDDAIPYLASYRICRKFGHQDGMPVIFSKEVDVATLEAGDLTIKLADGSSVIPGCVTPAPAEDLGEFRTILTIGDFGSIQNQPVSVEVTGNIISLDQQTNFKGAQVAVTPLEAGPTLVLAELVPPAQWQLNKAASDMPFGGGNGCPAGTQQIIRAVWAGGVTKPGGAEIDDQERTAYAVHVLNPDRSDQTAEQVITPFAIADLGDGDNNHMLCLDQAALPVRISFPAGLMTDPREDLNEATSAILSATPTS